MKDKLDIYCDYRFWEAFCDKEEEIKNDHHKRKLWDAFYDFLNSNNLFFNISSKSISKETCGGNKLLKIRHAKGGAEIRFIPEIYPRIEDASNDRDDLLNSVFLTILDSSVCKKLSSRYGVIVLNLSMVLTADHIFKEQKIPFDKTNGQNWSYLQKFKNKYPSISCCNSLIVVDRYLLSRVTDNGINTNLKPIFDALLPISLDNGIVFTICIISEDKEGPGISIEVKLKKIQNLVKELRPKLLFKLNIFNRFEHDRSILTNNVMLTSGAGFDVIGKKGVSIKFTTTSFCFPFFHSDSNDSSIFISWINNILNKKRKCQNFNVNYWGDKSTSHHLLDYYCEKPVKLRSTYSMSNEIADLFRHSCYKHSTSLNNKKEQ